MRRFGPAERWGHRTTALPMGVCVLTAPFPFIPALAQLVGRRALVVAARVGPGPTPGLRDRTCPLAATVPVVG